LNETLGMGLSAMEQGFTLTHSGTSEGWMVAGFWEKFGMSHSVPIASELTGSSDSTHTREETERSLQQSHPDSSHQEQVFSFLGKPTPVKVPKQAE